MTGSTVPENHPPVGSMEWSEDRSVLTVVFASDPPFAVKLSTQVVDETLHSLGLARSGMVPEIPDTWTMGVGVRSQRDPAYAIEADALAGDVLLHLRDHHMGWRHYIITKENARRLGEALIARADASQPAMSGTA